MFNLQNPSLLPCICILSTPSLPQSEHPPANLGCQRLFVHFESVSEKDKNIVPHLNMSPMISTSYNCQWRIKGGECVYQNSRILDEWNRTCPSKMEVALDRFSSIVCSTHEHAKLKKVKFGSGSDLEVPQYKVMKSTQLLTPCILQMTNISPYIMAIWPYYQRCKY